MISELSEVPTGISYEAAASPSFYIVGKTVDGPFVLKLDDSLNPLWAKGFRVRGADDHPNAVVF